ncbi:MAG: GntR family transcriptional regulator [Candidatus Omnitrophica bacterium]|nr:GntR family transcriptional regulator [Candidatus Omnitrophota bacterium]
MKKNPAIYYSTQIREDIRTRILTGVFRKGEKLPSEGEIAGMYGVSRMTARQALVELVVEGLIYRIPGKGTFVADSPVSAGRKTNGANKVIMIVPSMRHSFYWQIISAAGSVLEDYDIDMVIKCVEEDPIKEKKCFERLINDSYIGVLLIASYYTVENVMFLREISQKVPLVVMDVKIDDLKVDTVISDDRRGGFLATEHLIELGHRNILHLAGPEGDSSADNRRTGYIEALEKYNIQHKFKNIRFTDWSMRSGYYETKKFLMNDREGITAIFACNDEVAIGAYNAIKEAGKNVPENIALIGYGNLDVGKFLEVPLTSVEQSTDEMGRTGVRLLIERLSGYRKQDNSKDVVVPTRLVIRETCGINKKVRI